MNHDSYEYRTREKSKNRKMSVLWIVLNLIFLIVFNVFFFILGGTEHNSSVWISYGFIHFSYLMLVLTPILTRKGKSSAIFGFALYSISATYFFVALIMGIIFILIAPESHTAALLIQLSIAGIYGIILIANMLANEHTADAEEERQNQIEYVKTAATQLKVILDDVKDREAKRKVEAVYDAVYTSPVKSHANLEQMERRILVLIGDLDSAVVKGDKETIISIAKSLLSAVNERNSRLKNLHA